MQKIIYRGMAVIWLMLLLGCTRTIEGIKQDSSQLWQGTKQYIHDATEE